MKEGILVSVLKENRSLSKAEFVKRSRDIAVRSINTLSRLSARYARILSDDVKSCAVEGLVCCVKANSVFPTSFMRCTLREEYTLRAKACYDALDAQLALVYEILRTNPEGAFTDASGKRALDKKKAEDKLDKMIDILGNAIDEEQRLLKGQLDYIAETRRKIFNKTIDNYMKKGFSRKEAVRMANVEKEVQLKAAEIVSPRDASLSMARALEDEVQQVHISMGCAKDTTSDTGSVPENDINSQGQNADTKLEGSVPDAAQNVTIVTASTPDPGEISLIPSQGVITAGDKKRLDEIFGMM